MTPDPSDSSAESEVSKKEEEASKSEASEKAASPKVPTDDLSPWRKLTSLFPLFDFTRLPDTKVGWMIRIGVTGVALIVLTRHISREVGPMLAAKPPAAISAEDIEDYKFRIPERTRREIFTEIATAELAERQRAIAANTWNGHLWSREDDRGWQERIAVRTAAAKHRISLSQAFLVLDEGIRNKWPAPDGKPLSATTPPLAIRSNSW